MKKRWENRLIKLGRWAFWLLYSGPTILLMILYPDKSIFSWILGIFLFFTSPASDIFTGDDYEEDDGEIPTSTLWEFDPSSSK